MKITREISSRLDFDLILWIITLINPKIHSPILTIREIYTSFKSFMNYLIILCGTFSNNSLQFKWTTRTEIMDDRKLLSCSNSFPV